MSRKKDYSDWSKEELIEHIYKLENRKKYGLVWDEEREPEKVVLDCRENLPVLVEEKSREIKTDPDKPTHILIEGDNYHALSVLNYTHEKAVDVIYIDPPYNIGNKDFIYNDKIVDLEDSYKHSKWISFMYKRLLLSKNLLTKRGAIFVSIDDKEYPRLLLIMEEIFGEDNIKTICVKMSEPTGVKMASVIKTKRIPKLKEYLVIAKKDGIKDLYIEKLPKEKWDNEYKTIIINATEEEINKVKEIRDNEHRTNDEIYNCNDIIGNWKYKSLSEYFNEKKISKKQQEDFKYKNAWRIIQVVTLTGGARDIASKTKKTFKKIPNFFCIITPKKKLYLIKGEFNHETKLPRCKVLFADDYLTMHPGDFWYDIKTTGLDNEGGVPFKNGKKPLKLIERIIKTNENNNITVLDFFAGSGTTGEAVLRINSEDNGNRKFIICTYNEESETKEKIVDNYCYPRMINAIKGYKRKVGLGGNLKYFKTDFVPASPTDKNKEILTKRSVEMLCLKENTFDFVMEKEDIKIYENKDHYTGIIFDQLKIAEFKKIIRDYLKPVSVYIFSLGDDDFAPEFEDMIDKVKVSPIPEVILRVYRRIFK